MARILDHSTAEVTVRDDQTGESSTSHVVRHVTFLDGRDAAHTLTLFEAGDVPTSGRVFTHPDDVVAAFEAGEL